MTDLLMWLTAENSYWNNVALWLHAESAYEREKARGTEPDGPPARRWQVHQSAQLAAAVSGAKWIGGDEDA